MNSVLATPQYNALRVMEYHKTGPVMRNNSLSCGNKIYRRIKNACKVCHRLQWRQVLQNGKMHHAN